jgi:uncharacterized membrane protein
VSDVQTIAKGDGSRLVEPRRFVVRDRSAFASIWAAHAGPDASTPVVDFESHMVAAVFAGERPTPGYEVDITGTRREGGALVVIVEERLPDPALAAAQVIVSPFHIVTFPRDDGEIRFSSAGAAQHHATFVFKPPPRQATSAQSARTSISRLTGRTLQPAEWLGDGSSSTGLTPQVAATMAYLAGPFSGALLLATERTSRFVRFHAWQAVFGLGVLGTAAVLFLMLAFVLLIVSPAAFWAMLWLAALTGVAWVVVWAICLRNAYKGEMWKLPVAGDYAERYATLVNP